MTVISLLEGGPSVEVAIPALVARGLALTGAVTAVPSTQPSNWVLTPTLKVGVVAVGDIQLIIAPKVDIERLVFLLGYASDVRGWNSNDVVLDSSADLLPAMARAFARQAERATRRGLLQGYRTVEESLSVVRGRIRVADQLRRRPGQTLPLEVTYDEYDVDIAENRILKAAARRLLRIPGLAVDVRRALLRLTRVRLADVADVPARPRWRANRLNIDYQPALRLADVVLSAQSFDLRVGDLTVSQFLFDMSKVFEDFVCLALREVWAGGDGRSILQYRTHLDVGRQVVIKPDLVRTHKGRPTAVVDAKYKAEKPSGFPQADLYQLFAYCTVLDLAVGHLVYARGNEPEAEYSIVNAGTRIVAHALDLNQPTVDLMLRLQQLALAIMP